MAVARHPPTHALPPSASARYFAAVARRIVLVTVFGDERVDCRRAYLRPRSRTVARTRDFTQRARRRNDRAAVCSNGKHHSAATHVFHFTREKSARSSPARARCTRARIRGMYVQRPRFPRDSHPVLSAEKKTAKILASLSRQCRPFSSTTLRWRFAFHAFPAVSAATCAVRLPRFTTAAATGIASEFSFRAFSARANVFLVIMTGLRIFPPENSLHVFFYRTSFMSNRGSFRSFPNRTLTSRRERKHARDSYRCAADALLFPTPSIASHK